MQCPEYADNTGNLDRFARLDALQRTLGYSRLESKMSLGNAHIETLAGKTLTEFGKQVFVGIQIFKRHKSYYLAIRWI